MEIKKQIDGCLNCGSKKFNIKVILKKLNIPLNVLNAELLIEK